MRFLATRLDTENSYVIKEDIHENDYFEEKKKNVCDSCKENID